MKTPIFKEGDTVRVRFDHNIQGVVTNPCEKTDMCAINGTPIEFYVKVLIGGKDLGYHQENVELVSESVEEGS